MGELFIRPTPAEPLRFTGERLTSETAGQTMIEHMHRYLYARELCRHKAVLDVASGEGYGAALLAQVATTVTGIEIDRETVDHARSSYQCDNLRFLQGDARSMQVPPETIDVVVSFETIEHLAEQACFLDEIHRVLRPGGMLIVSTPDRDNYSPAWAPPNPFHVLELTQSEFIALLARHFAHVRCVTQRPIAGSVMLPLALDCGTTALLCFETRGNRHFEASLGLARPQYVVALASDQPIDAPAASAYFDGGLLPRLTPQNGSAAPDALSTRGDAELTTALPTQLQELELQIEAQREQLRRWASANAALESSNARAEQACAVLREQLAAGNDQLLASVYASTSWRVTAPLRAIKRRLISFRG